MFSAGGVTRAAIRKVDTAGINVSVSSFGDIAVDRAGNILCHGYQHCLQDLRRGEFRSSSASADRDGDTNRIVIATSTCLATGPATADIDLPPATLAGHDCQTLPIRPASPDLRVSTTQNTYQIPRGTAPGAATVTITAGGTGFRAAGRGSSATGRWYERTGPLCGPQACSPGSISSKS